MTARIKTVTMQYFRGAAQPSQIKFDLSKKLVMIFGENGTGKSTIIDAIDLVCNEKSSIADRSGTSPKDHLPSLGSDPTQVEVEIAFDSGTWKGTLNKSGKILIQGAQKKPVVYVLRRASLLKLNEATPSERYNELQKFINVQAIETAEARLSDALKTTKKRLEETIRDLQTNQDNLKELWEQEGKPSTDCLTWGQEKTTTDPSDLRLNLTRLEEQLPAYQASLQTQQAWRQNQMGFQTAQQTLEEINTQTTTTASKLTGQLYSILEAVQQHLRHTASPDVHCPICQQTIEPIELQSAINSRLAEAAQIKILNEQRTANQAGFNKAETRLETAKTNFLTAANRFNLMLKPEAQHSGVMNPENMTLWLEGLTTPMQGASLELEKIRKTLDGYTAVKNLVGKIKEHSEASLKFAALENRLTAILQIVRTQRINFVQTIFNSVSTDCQNLYTQLHPNEPIGLERLHMDENRKGSLHQEASFHGSSSISPQGFYSEAHLDTLGFCFWLAVAKHGGQKPIVVLDDVFTSVDSEHLTRIGELLVLESNNFAQIILTTHFRGWLDKFKYELPDSLDLHELQFWTPTHGVRSHKTQPATQELENAMQTTPFDRQVVAAKTGVLLEALLENFTLEYACSVPRKKPAQYTLGELLEPSIKTAKSLKVQQRQLDANHQAVLPEVFIDLDLCGALENCRDLTFIRNQVGAHFNLSGSALTDADILRFGQTALEVARILICPKCGLFAFKKNQKTHRDCGGTCRHSRITTK